MISSLSALPQCIWQTAWQNPLQCVKLTLLRFYLSSEVSNKNTPAVALGGGWEVSLRCWRKSGFKSSWEWDEHKNCHNVSDQEDTYCCVSPQKSLEMRIRGSEVEHSSFSLAAQEPGIGPVLCQLVWSLRNPQLPVFVCCGKRCSVCVCWFLW